MPLWEHVPDGEPRVFTYNGETRIYLYGSHDTKKTDYCGPDYVVWSAPVDDLTNWTCHGVCYTASDGGDLYAPDVVYKDGIYYMYAAENRGSSIMLVKSDKPWGPFTDPVKTELGFDPGILVDDDGRVYAYWGFCESHAGELNDDMACLRLLQSAMNIRSTDLGVVGSCNGFLSYKSGAILPWADSSAAAISASTAERS